MPRSSRSLYAFRLLEPDEQFDLFACRENRLHLAERQLELSDSADKTLCGSVLPAFPRWHELEAQALTDKRLCPSCKALFKARRNGAPSPTSSW